MAKPQADLAVVTGLQSRSHRCRAPCGGDRGREILRGRVAGVLAEHAPELCFRRVVVLAFEVLASLGPRDAMPRVALDTCEAMCRPVIARLDDQHAPVKSRRVIELPGRARG